MNRRQLVPTLTIAVLMGVLVVYALNGFELPIPHQGRNASARLIAAPEIVATATGTATTEAPSPSPTPTMPPAPRPTATPAAPPGPDVDDVLLLYTTGITTVFDTNFCKVAEYYGLTCQYVDLAAPLAEEDVHDANGVPFKLIGMSAANLSQLGERDIALLQSTIQAGTNLLVYEAAYNMDRAVLSALTGGSVIGALGSHDSVRNWTVTTTAPEVTREFSGWTVELPSVLPQTDNMIVLRSEDAAEPLIVSSDDFGDTYPIFARIPFGGGMAYVHAGDKGQSLDEVPLRQLYYQPENFTTVVPLMMTMSHVMGDEAWHTSTNYANLTLDDPPLTQRFENLDYAALLDEMQQHAFSTTIAFMPINVARSEQEVISLFTNHPDHYSLVQHGNNGDGYEFYYYSLADAVGPGTPTPEPDLAHTARPLSEQETDIVQGLEQMLAHEQDTGVGFDRVMVFPQGISPEETLVVLKRLNYLATVNAQDIPLGAARVNRWDEGMYVASLDYANFPVIARRDYANSYENPDTFIQAAIFDLFIGRPALFWSHPVGGELFARGIDEFNVIADRVNALPGGVQWVGLGDAIRRAYREKRADDGSIDVQMFGPEIRLENTNRLTQLYHLAKQETLNVPIQSVTVGGVEVPYRVEDGFLRLDITVPGQSEVSVLITYRNELNLAAGGN